MPSPDHHEIRETKIIASAAAPLSEAAGNLIAGLTQLANPTDPRAKSLFSVLRSSTNTGMSFRISTVHGQIEALFDHAFKGNTLVGRYRFFALQEVASAGTAAAEIWTVLFDANHNATWEPDEEFGWNFQPGGTDALPALGEFMLRLLSKQQASLSRY